MMRLRAALLLVLLFTLQAFAATERNWQTGTLMESEQLKVPSSSTKTSSTDGTAKPKGDNTKYSENTTSTTTQDYDTFQVFTIEGATKIYTVKQRLLFPWSKPANITVGEKVKYAIEKNTMYLQDDDGKEAKTSITKVKMKAAE